MTQRIEPSFFCTCLQELNLLFFVHDSKNWTFFFKFDSKNWTLFFWNTTQRIECDSKNCTFFPMWLKELNFFLMWLKELNFFCNVTQKIELFFILLTLFSDSMNWTFLFFEFYSKNWTFFLNMTPRIESFFFEYDSMNWTCFYKWLNELNLFL